MNRPILIPVMVTILLGFLSIGVQAEIVPDSKVQEQLSEMFIAHSEEAWKSKEPIIRETAENIKKKDAAARHRFLEQLVYFTAFNEAYQKSFESPFAVGLFIKWAEFTEPEILDATIHHWIGASDPLKRAIQDTWIGAAVEQRYTDTNPTGYLYPFNLFIPYLDGSQDEENFALESWVDFVFYQSSWRAFLTLEKIYGPDEKDLDSLRSKVRGLPEASSGSMSEFDLKKFNAENLEKLEGFATSPDWWARMYALSVVRHADTPETQAMVSALTEDENDLVKRAALRAIGEKVP